MRQYRQGSYLEHLGIKGKSGRYPWGSGENPFHHGPAAPGMRRVRWPSKRVDRLDRKGSKIAAKRKSKRLARKVYKYNKLKLKAEKVSLYETKYRYKLQRLDYASFKNKRKLDRALNRYYKLVNRYGEPD